MKQTKNPNAVALGKRGGIASAKVQSDAKRAAARANGSLGGRPSRSVDFSTLPVGSKFRRRGYDMPLVKVAPFAYALDIPEARWKNAQDNMKVIPL